MQSEEMLNDAFVALVRQSERTACRGAPLPFALCKGRYGSGGATSTNSMRSGADGTPHRRTCHLHQQLSSWKAGRGCSVRSSS